MFSQFGIGSSLSKNNSTNNTTNNVRDSGNFVLSSSGNNQFNSTQNINSITSKAPSSVNTLQGFMTSGDVKNRAAAEFDDDEIMDDEEIQLPPPLRDLDAENGRNTSATISANNKGGSKAPSSWASKGRSNNDEFDF
mmetsp:Transcript_1828/g.2539  ORF Transcript_1828/g.2539 Transcript_1828/m.2539 type:complete len:137 (+) Transcript_1828:1-411(+)